MKQLQNLSRQKIIKFAEIVLVLLLFELQAQAQQNVGIGTTTPDSSALLELSATDKGMLVPRVTALQRSAIVNPANGLLVFDTDSASFWFYNASSVQWEKIGSGGGGGAGGTLDDAYDFGGAGAGRVVIGDAGPVVIVGTGTVSADTGRLHVSTVGGTVGTPSTAISGDINTATSVGFGLVGTVSNSDNPGAAIYAESNGTGQTISATMTGTGSAGLFQVTNATSAFSAVSGSSNGSGDVILGQMTGSTGRAASFAVVNSASATDALYVTTNGTVATALRADNTNTGVSVRGVNSNAANIYSALQAESNSTNANAAGVVGDQTGAGPGVAGQISNPAATSEAAVLGINTRTTGGHGVKGTGVNGVVGESNYRDGFAIYGRNYDLLNAGNAVGVYGLGYVGVWGEPNAGTGLYGVYSNGDFAASGTKAFQIDHPLDPENKFLRHFTIESPEVLNMYRGNILLDSKGEGIVTLPDYFTSINTNFSYQLTSIGSFAQLYIKEKINTDNQFVISGGKANMEISWVVYAERNDQYMQRNPKSKEVELEKRESLKGKYLIPEIYDQPENRAILQQPELQKSELINIHKGEATPIKIQEPIKMK
ncbi:hypothetical protein JYT51_00070 [Candidatus Amoebophilus asiaticus]|nr:hypothetical protein [Candidatus Amoebophilus asiaticus]